MAQQLLESHLEDPVQQLSSRLDICSALHYGGIVAKDAVAFTVYECLYECLQNALGLIIGPDDRLAELGVDSITAVHLVASLNEKGIDITYESLSSISKVKDLLCETCQLDSKIRLNPDVPLLSSKIKTIVK